MKYPLRLTILGSLVLSSAVACGGSDSSDGNTGNAQSAATSDDYDDVAQGLGVAVAFGTGGGDVGSLSDTADLVVGVSPLDITVKGAGEFAGVRAGVNLDYQISCKDASGQALAACGLGTDSADAAVNWSGDLALPNFTASVDRTGDWQVTGLKSGYAEFSGNGDLTFDATFQSSFRNTQRHWSLKYTADYAAVRVQLLPRLIASGSVKYSVDASRQASSDSGESAASFHIDAALTFANGAATLVLDGSHSYGVDVNSGAVVRVSAR